MRRKTEKTLTVPAQLTVAVMVAAGCAPVMEAGDVSARDATQSRPSDVAEVPRIDGGCYSGSLYLGQNRRCFPSYPATSCRAERACRASECGEGCALCNEVFQCFPMVVRPGDDAAIVADAAAPRCDSPRYTCDRYGCEPGCQTIPAPIETGGGVG
ncbi:MAG: hypothetical protein U0269_24750 [Polyangiales bacterium]